MKKIFVFVSILLTLFTFSACGKSDVEVVMANMSERTNVYFWGQNETMCASLAVGEREKNYCMDGESGENTAFSLLTISFLKENDLLSINVTILIDENQFEQEVEYIPTVASFVCDLQKNISGSEKIEIKYEKNAILLENLSKNFGVDSNKAIELGCKEFEKEIGEIRKGSRLLGECYLKILDKKKNNFEEFFWCFTLIDINGNNFSVVVSTVDGKTLAKS